MFNIYKHISAYILLIFVVLFCHYNAQAQQTDQFKADAIINEIASSTNWTKEKQIDTFKIAVYGFSGVFKQLKRQAATSFINGKEIKVSQFKKIQDIRYVHILFVPQTRLSDLQHILKILKHNTLIVTDQCPSKVYMVNFKKKNIGGKYIDISYLRAKIAGITFDESFIDSYGKEDDMKRLITLSQKKYNSLKENFEKQQKEIATKKQELKSLEVENETEIAENKKQKDISIKQAEEIEAQKEALQQKVVMLNSIEKDLSKQQNKLNKNEKELNEQKNMMNSLADSVQIIIEQLDKQKRKIKENQKIIDQKESDITEQSDYIKLQRLSILGFTMFFIAIIILAYYVFKSYKSTKKINAELKAKNIDISRQTEEISQQNEQTELLNEELKKLSMVAAQTDNAVTIMDSQGNFEWVNVGYTKMYGYTLQLLKNEKGLNLLDVSNVKNIKSIFEKCTTEKRTVVYETLNKTRKGNSVWVQVNLTPILDSKGDVSKLITVSIDISRMKEAENNLRDIHKKILDQSKQLETINKELQKLSLVARETDNAIAIMDIAGNYQWINEGYSRLLGYTYNQLISEFSGNIINKYTSKTVKTLIKKCIEEEISVSYEEYKTKRDNSKIWIHTTLTPIRGKDNKLHSIISISQNIEELKNSENAIRDLNYELEEQYNELLLRKTEAEQLNERILTSINYAQTIQSNILPIQKNIDKYFESFIIFRPKDIVSGDFYWHAVIPAANNNNSIRHIMAAVDCTGHGVPGAFMSVIGHRLLNDIVKVRGISDPSEILEKLNELVKKVLRQDKNRNNDGMDVCICSFERVKDSTTSIISFAGAKRPLYYYRQKQKQLGYIKGARRSIGGTQIHRNQEDFKNYEILLEKGDCVYLSTDGIIDQPAPSRMRFGSIRFRKIISDIATKPLEEQKQEIVTTLEQYQDTAEQRDDITLLGIKV